MEQQNHVFKARNPFQKAIKNPLIFVFATLILGLAIADVLYPVRETSQLENRPLAQRPQFSAQRLFNNTYTQDYETFINDQFLFRDGWITIKSAAERALLKIENNGIILGKDGYLFEKALVHDREKFGRNLAFVQAFLEKYPEANITVGLIPSAYQVLENQTPLGFMNIDQTAIIKQTYAQLRDQADTLDVLGALGSHKEEQIYYKTDHHWTSLGAYYAYVAFCEQNALTPVDLATLGYQDVEGFYGTHYSKAKTAGLQADVIRYYEIPTTQVEINGQAVDGLYDLQKLQTRDKYAMFLWGNNGLTVIRSENHLAPTDKARKILIIKDSYSNTMAPFFTYNYDEVHLVDARYFSALSAIVDVNSYDDVLLLYSYDNFSTDNHLAKLKY